MNKRKRKLIIKSCYFLNKREKILIIIIIMRWGQIDFMYYIFFSVLSNNKNDNKRYKIHTKRKKINNNLNAPLIKKVSYRKTEENKRHLPQIWNKISTFKISIIYTKPINNEKKEALKLFYQINKYQ